MISSTRNLVEDAILKDYYDLLPKGGIFIDIIYSIADVQQFRHHLIRRGGKKKILVVMGRAGSVLSFAISE